MFCSVDNCDRPVWSGGLCVAHYFRVRRTGEAREDIPIGEHPQQTTCSLEDCRRPLYARGLCEMHYRRVQRNGDTERLRPPGRQTCEVEGCDKETDARGLCHAHYQRLRRTGSVDGHTPVGRRRSAELCGIEGCERRVYSRGLCRTHHKRRVTHGDALAGGSIRRTTGEGSLNGGGYRKVPVPEHLRHLSNSESTMAEHRLVMAQHLGRPLHPGEVVHHRNGIRTDNRIENLVLLASAHPKGQEIPDLVSHAVGILKRYRPDLLVAGRSNTSQHCDEPGEADAKITGL